jgi:hypothetical protein
MVAEHKQSEEGTWQSMVIADGEAQSVQALLDEVLRAVYEKRSVTMHVNALVGILMPLVQADGIPVDVREDKAELFAHLLPLVGGRIRFVIERVDYAASFKNKLCRYVAASVCKQMAGLSRYPAGYNNDKMVNELWHEIEEFRVQTQGLSDQQSASQVSVGGDHVDIVIEDALKSSDTENTDNGAIPLGDKDRGLKDILEGLSHPIPNPGDKSKTAAEAKGLSNPQKSSSSNTIQLEEKDSVPPSIREYFLTPKKDKEKQRSVSPTDWREMFNRDPNVHRADPFEWLSRSPSIGATGQCNSGKHDTVDRALFPEFAERQGKITQDDRFRAAKFVNQIKPQGVVGITASNGEFRKKLRELKEVSESNGCSSLEYQYLFNSAFSSDVRMTAPDEPCGSFEQLVKLMATRFKRISDRFVGDKAAAIVLARNAVGKFRQGEHETVSSCARRFENALLELQSLGGVVDSRESAISFAQSLNRHWIDKALGNIKLNETGYQELRDILVTIERMKNHGHSSSNSERTNQPHNSGTDKTSGSQDSDKKISKGPCWVCAGDHRRDVCPISEEHRNCKKCGKAGHVSKACRSDVKKVDLQILSMRGDQEDEPITLTCSIGDSEIIPVLADTGAHCALISKSMVDEIAPPKKFARKTDTTYRLHFADDGMVETRLSVILPVVAWVKDEVVEANVLFIIAPKVNGEVLLGRSALRTLGLDISLQVRTQANQEQEPIPVTVNFFTAEQEYSVPEIDQYIDHSKQPNYEDTYFQRALEETLSKATENFVTLEETIEQSLSVLDEIPFEISDGYKIMLRRVPQTGQHDTKNQKFAFTVSWRVQAQSSGRGWDSSGLIAKLTPSQREEWDKHVEVFTSSTWWRKTNGDIRSARSTVFPVQQKETKTTRVRPCCDMRIVNSISPRVSAKISTVQDAVFSLRNCVEKHTKVIQVDLVKAFYRIHTQITTDSGDPYPLVLQAGKHTYLSDRLVFGLACGPAALNAAQFMLQKSAEFVWKKFYKERLPVDLITVMDDFLITGEASAVERHHDIMSSLWELTGFDQKMNIWVEGASQQWLGQQWTLTESGVSMKRNEIEMQIPDIWTKRHAFRLAGKFTNLTGGYSEARARVHADAVRQIAGQFEQWDTPCQDQLITSNLIYHIQQAATLWQASKLEDENLSSLNKIDSLEIRVDASQSGFGFIFLQGERIVYADAKLFGKNTVTWHANRREFHALSQAVMKLDTMLQLFPALKTVTVRTDSKVTVAHADEFRNIATKSIERKVLLRMRNAILEIAYMWKQQGINFSVRHISGMDNTIADTLSRETERRKAVSFVQLELVELRSLPAYMEWTRKREAFLVWRNKELPQGKENMKKFLLADQGNFEDEELQVKVINDRRQVIVSQELATAIIRHLHVQLGHARLTSVLNAFYEVVFHEKARKLALKELKRCTECAMSNPHKGSQESYGPVYRPTKPFEMIGIDLFGPLQRPLGTGGTKKHVLTVVCRLTGYTRFILLEDAKAKTVVDALERYIWELGAQIRVLVSDNGPQFVLSPLLRGLCLMRGIQHITLPLYAPFAGGFYEIRHRVAVRCLRTLLVQFPFGDWATLLAVAQSKVNSHVGTDRSCSPHQLIYGWKYVYPTIGAIQNGLQGGVAEVDWNDPFTSPEQEAKERSDLRDEFLKIWEQEFQARQDGQSAAFRPVAEAEALALGDWVVWKKEKIRRKFERISEGPYRLIEKVGRHTWMIQNEEMLIPLKVHARGLKRIDHEAIAEKSDETKRLVHEGSGNEDISHRAIEDGPESHEASAPASPTGKEIGRSLPKERFSAEERFLASLHETRSSTGRLRRGSLIEKY